jgi:hypothetical protein
VGHRMDLDVSDNILPLPGFEPTTKSWISNSFKLDTEETLTHNVKV